MIKSEMVPPIGCNCRERANPPWHSLAMADFSLLASLFMIPDKHCNMASLYCSTVSAPRLHARLVARRAHPRSKICRVCVATEAAYELRICVDAQCKNAGAERVRGACLRYTSVPSLLTCGASWERSRGLCCADCGLRAAPGPGGGQAAGAQVPG